MSNSLSGLCNALGLNPKESSSLKNALSHEAIRASYMIWLNRANKDMMKRQWTPIKLDDSLSYTDPIEY